MSAFIHRRADMNTLAKSEHIEIEQRTSRGHDYFVIFFYEHGKLIGFDKVYDRDAAFKIAIKYLEVHHGYNK